MNYTIKVYNIKKIQFYFKIPNDQQLAKMHAA